MSQKTTFKFNHISVSFHVSGESKVGDEVLPFSFNENSSLDLANDSQVNIEVINKPYLNDLIPVLLKRAVESYDPENVNAKKLKEQISAIGK